MMYRCKLAECWVHSFRVRISTGVRSQRRRVPCMHQKQASLGPLRHFIPCCCRGPRRVRRYPARCATSWRHGGSIALSAFRLAAVGPDQDAQTPGHCRQWWSPCICRCFLPLPGSWPPTPHDHSTPLATSPSAEGTAPARDTAHGTARKADSPRAAARHHVQARSGMHDVATSWPASLAHET